MLLFSAVGSAAPSSFLFWPHSLCGGIVVLKMLPGEFVPSQDLSRMSIRLQTAVGSDLSETNKLITKAESMIAERPEVTQLFSWVGG